MTGVVRSPALEAVVAFVQAAVSDAEEASWQMVEASHNADGSITSGTDILSSSTRVESILRYDLRSITRGSRWLNDTTMDAYLAILQVRWT